MERQTMPGLDRRLLLKGGAALGAAAALSGCTQNKPDAAPEAATGGATGRPPSDMTVHLIGTGGPEMTPGRMGISTLVRAGDQNVLFDVGRGATQNLYESRIHPKHVTNVFLTHLHNDHYEGLPSLWLNPWFMFGRKEKISLWGPPGTASMVEGMRAMFAHDVEHRANDLFKREYLDIAVTEIEDAGVYTLGGLSVTAFTVEHAEGNPAFGFRVDRSDRSVLLSGDTTLHQNVIDYGQGCDLMVHNVVAFSEELTKSGKLQVILDKLTTPEQAAEVFLEAKPRAAVFSHIVKKELHGAEGDQVIMERTRAAGYEGPLHMGIDRMTFEIGEEVQMYDPISTTDLPDLDNVDVEL